MTKHKLPLVWIQGIRDEDKRTEFEGAIRSSTVALGRLDVILSMYIEELEMKEVNEDYFHSPEWAARQAFYLGQKKAYKRLQHLLEGVVRPND